MLKNFEIDEQFLTDVTVKTEFTHLENPKDPTDDDLIKILKDHHSVVSIGSKDHDEFAVLRTRLEELGYIEIEHRWWNGDRVLKSFKLNGWTMRKGSQFPCATALGNSIRCAKKFGWKSLA
jgi:hypothetical protein